MPDLPGVRRRPWLASALLAAWPMATLAVERCRVVGSADPPFRYLRQQEAGGLYYELLRAAAARSGWPLEFSEAPAARALLLMQSGEADLMVGPLRRLEREAYLHYSRVTLPAEDKSVYARPGAAPLQRLEQLRGQRVGVLRGKRYGGGFDELTGLQRVELNDYDSALQMLALDLREQALGWPGETPYLVLARRSPWLARVTEIERAFDALRQSGEWDRIVARY